VPSGSPRPPLYSGNVRKRVLRVPSSPTRAIGGGRQRKKPLRPCLLADSRYGISGRSNQAGELLVRNSLSHNPNLYAIIEVKLVARASELASVHSSVHDVRKLIKCGRALRCPDPDR
jgi:hypothetical protein